MREANSILRQCHDFIWQGGKLNPIESWGQIVLFLIAKRKLDKQNRQNRDYKAKDFELMMAEIDFEKNKLDTTILEKLIDLTGSITTDVLYTGDTREQLLGNFLRKDLGQFFTPKPAIDLIIGMIPPKEKMKIGDLCMGPGRFLSEAGGREPSVEIYGADISQDMVKQVKIEFKELLDINGEFERHDTMTPWDKVDIKGIEKESFDRLYTNVPFGVKGYDESYIMASIISKGQNSVPAEVLLLEKHLEALGSNGKLGIVVPDSILSNFSLRYVRDFIVENYRINAVISLPVHTFSHSDAVVKASVLIITNEKSDLTDKVFMASLENIGYDNRGYETESDIDELLKNWDDYCSKNTVPNNQLGYLKTQDELRDRMTAGRPLENKIPNNWQEISIQNIVKSPIQSGRTPTKSDYDDSNFKILKVRDLSPVQIDWNNSKKGLVSKSFFEKSDKGRIEEGDILIINSAHHKKYIGKNVNIVDNIPEKYNGRTMCSGEVMIIRIDDSKVNPYFVQNWLKTSEGYNQIQEAVRGQTAHLYPQDVKKIILPIPSGEDVLQVEAILESQKDVLIKITSSVEKYISKSDEFQNLWEEK